jgi:predicted phosphoadenosine phosphosulfate sulfurtransferase
MAKTKLGISVLQAAQERISWTFDNFERVYLSFSAGKDSTVMLHLVAAEARRRGRQIGLLLIDLEGQYKLTMDHAEKCFHLYRDCIDPYWVCAQIHLRNAVSVYEPHWLAWDETKQPAWIRPKPGYAYNENWFPFYTPGMEFEEFVPEFGEWYGQGKSCACFVGIRSDESLNRYRTIASDNKRMKDGLKWTSHVCADVYNIYPIYDWNVQDLWIYQGKNPLLPYNKLYDLMYKAGLTLSQMRICQPYGDDQRRGLWLFHLIEPETWARVVARVNGANSGALYIQEHGNVNGYRAVSKPAGHTWQSFAMLLLGSMPDRTKVHYDAKLTVFIKWWMDRGYPEGIPDEADYRMEQEKKAPSWRRICKSFLRNDYWFKGAGFSQTKSEAYGKYLAMIKKKKEKFGLPDYLSPITEQIKQNATINYSEAVG